MEQEFSLREDNYENDDFCRGYDESPYKVNINNEDDIIDDYHLNNNDYDNQKNINDNINDIAPEMPNEFYQNVESFLSKAPPKINDTIPTKLKKLTNNKTNNEKDVSNQSNNIQNGMMFPRINHLNPPQPPHNYNHIINNNNIVNNNGINNNKASKVKSKIYNDANKKNKSHIDHKLLQEAFEYTDMLLKESILQNENEQILSEEYHVSSNNNSNSKINIISNQNRTYSLENIYNTTNTITSNNNNEKKNKIKTNSTNNAVGIVKKLRNKSISSTKNSIEKNNNNNIDINNDNSNFMIGIKNENDNIEDKKNAINFNELIINFQDGITLQKLKKDLEESQKSMKKSEDFMKQLSKEFSINIKR